MKVLVFSLLSFICLSAQAQNCLEGVVTNSSDNRPMPNVLVSIPELGYAVRTDDLGTFSFCDIAYGTLILQADHDKYERTVSTVYFSTEDSRIALVLSQKTVSYPEVFISGTQSSKLEESPNDVTTISSEEMREAGAFSLTDGLAKLPGVSQLSTGVGISKPVLRGLYGNRIQTVLFGMRFDNQQWQDEHGLGLSDVGVDRVEVIKGASTLLYGSEAMGGVLQILEEKPAVRNSIEGDFSNRFFSNTFGNATDAGIKGSKNKISWKVRLGYETHADYTDGNGKRVLNSRFGGLYSKSGFSYRTQKWLSQNNYQFSQNNFGFILEASTLNLENDARQSRTFQMPHHTVNLNVFSSENTFFLPKSKLKLNIGAQYNERQEQEGGSKISLDMLLATGIGKVLWEKPLTNQQSLVVGSEFIQQTNRNVGSRSIVPDANMGSQSLFGYYKKRGKSLFFETGLRVDRNRLHSFSTGTINVPGENPGKTIVPFLRDYLAVNGSVGLSYVRQNWNIKGNLSSGYRPGNLAELSSNGLHEGSVRYEIGNVDLKTEKNICLDLYVSRKTDNTTLALSTFANRFLAYIYLTPTTQEYIGYQLFVFTQKNALITGAEAAFNVHPKRWAYFQWNNSYSSVYGKTDQGDNLPFIPAQNVQSSIRFSKSKVKNWKNVFVQIEGRYTLAQNQFSIFETRTSDYFLLNASVGIQKEKGRHTFSFSIAGNNLTNTVYFDHLSRFKYFGIYNIGQSIQFNFKIHFHENNSKN